MHKVDFECNHHNPLANLATVTSVALHKIKKIYHKLSEHSAGRFCLILRLALKNGKF